MRKPLYKKLIIKGNRPPRASLSVKLHDRAVSIKTECTVGVSTDLFRPVQDQSFERTKKL